MSVSFHLNDTSHIEYNAGLPCGNIFDGTNADLLKEYNVELKGPFNYSARDEAGLPRDWYENFPSRFIVEHVSSQLSVNRFCSSHTRAL